MQQSERLWILADDADARHLAADHPNLATVGRGAHCDMEWLERQDHPQGQQIRICLKGQEASGTIPLPGLHNTHNALMALGAAHDAGVGLAEGLAALADFASVGRRFEQFRHDGVIWLRDYAHHPTEIRALLESIRALKPRRILLGYQPHRYSRTQRLLPQFVRAFQGVDRLDLLPVYAASELPAQGVDSEVLAKACMRELDIPVTVWPDRETLRTHWQTMAQPGDVVAVVGAGDIGGLWEAARDSGDA
jgi:UDP-N-acetylmuramate--alanine ligase